MSLRSVPHISDEKKTSSFFRESVNCRLQFPSLPPSTNSSLISLLPPLRRPTQILFSAWKKRRRRGCWNTHNGDIVFPLKRETSFPFLFLGETAAVSSPKKRRREGKGFSGRRSLEEIEAVSSSCHTVFLVSKDTNAFPSIYHEARRFTRF